MAQIREFTVEGLAGRTEPVSLKLNRDVNVFFGVNGSGKTTLLKILHSALSTETDILKDLPFTRATVKVYLNRHRREFIRTYVPVEQATKRDTDPSPSPHQVPLWDAADFSIRTATALPSNLIFDYSLNKVVEAPKWTSEPAEPNGSLTMYTSGFLPISRLYRNLRTATGSNRLSDQELDTAFARSLQAKWAEYYADISKETALAQERGLANILGFFLGSQDASEISTPPDEKEAFKRISGFLQRQPGFAHLVPSESKFAAIYVKKPELQTVVQQIETVETRIAKITEPRERFRNVLESMFSGSKHLTFTEKEIKVQLSKNQEIGLSLLSSGEKQLLFIALFALTASNSSLIIDEPELSMHVDWQKKLVATLQDLNPEAQLILATHSPEIMADLPDSEIFQI